MKTIQIYNKNVDIYNVREFDYSIINSFTTIEDRKKKYYNEFMTFDIETTSVIKDKKSYGFMYVWQVCFNGIIILGRTWEEFIELIDIICNNMPYGNKIVCYIHNLSFEFQWIRNFFKITDVFSKGIRKVLKCTINDKIELRCSYMLSNMSLEKFTNKTEDVYFKKQSGEDFDYRIYRNIDYKLTEKELGYCVCDVLGLWECINNYLKEDTIISIPMTSTGFVRRDYQNVCLNDTEHMKRFHKCKLTPRQYLLCKDASRGGISGSNHVHTDTLLEFVQSFDIKSSYPYQMATKYFPSSKFVLYQPEYGNKLFNKLIYTKCCLIVMQCENIKLKKYSSIPYISKAKCKAIERGDDGYFGNGKVYKAKKIGFCCTEIDLEIINDSYTFENPKILEMWCADRGMLSKAFRKHLMDMFQKKCDLDGVDDFLYAKYKNKINASFGMMLTDILFPEIEYREGATKDVFKVHKIETESDMKNALDKYYNNKKSFLNYQDGVWVLAHARKSLYEGMKLVKHDITQVDTDSVKALADLFDYRKLFNEINKRIIKECDSFDVKPMAINRDGSVAYLGIWEYEALAGKDKPYSYRYFRTLGAKKYCYDNGDGLHITVAGLDKKKGAKWLEKNGGINKFTCGTVVPPEYSGRTAAIYNDCATSFTMFERGIEILSGSNIAIKDVPYTFGMTQEWFDLVLDGKVSLDTECEQGSGNLWCELEY